MYVCLYARRMCVHVPVYIHALEAAADSIDQLVCLDYVDAVLRRLGGDTGREKLAPLGLHGFLYRVVASLVLCERGTYVDISTPPCRGGITVVSHPYHRVAPGRYCRQDRTSAMVDQQK